MKTRAFKKALSVLCVLSMLLSLCVVCFAGTASAATTYTFNNSGKITTANLESGAALSAPEAAVDCATFLGWYDKTFTTKYDKAGSETELYAKYDANVYTFDDGKGYYDPNGKWGTHNSNSDFRIVDDPLNTYAGNKVVEACNKEHGHGMTMGLASYNGLDGGLKLEAGKEYVLTLKAYVTGVADDATHMPRFAVYRGSDAGIGVASNKTLITSEAHINGNTAGWVDVAITIPAQTKANLDAQPYLLLYADGETWDEPPFTTIIYFDDVIVAERTEKKITLVDKGVESVVTLKPGAPLPTKVAGSFLGWYNKDLSTKYTTAPSKNTTLYAIYNGTYANFEKTGYWDPNNKLGTAGSAKVVADPLGKQGKVAFFNMVGNNNMMNFAPSAAEGISAPTKLAAGQYRLRLKYYATDVSENGFYFDVRTANAAVVGQSGEKPGAIIKHKVTKSTDGWEELELIFTVNAAQAAFDSVIICAQDGYHYGGGVTVDTTKCTAKVYVDEIDIKPYMDASGINAFKMNFEATDGFKWSVADANNFTDSTGNGYVTRGEILADATTNHYFQVKHFRNKNGYFWFTIDDGAEQFKLVNGGIYTIKFKYNLAHVETPTSIGVLAVDPTKANSISPLGEIASYDLRDDLEARDNSEWVEVEYTFTANTASNRTSLGIYLKNSTNVPVEYASIVNFDDIVVTTLSISGEDGVVTFDDKGGDFTINPIIVEAGSTLKTLPTITKYGYDLVAWKYDVLTGTDKDGKPVYEAKTLTADTVIDAGKLEVYAVWKLSADSLELHFKSNVPAFDEIDYTVVVKAGDKIAKLPPNPAAAGQKFLGWYFDTTFKTALDVNKAPSKPGVYNVYAKWDKAGVLIDYEAFDNKNHGSDKVSYRFSIRMFEGNKVLCYDLGQGSNNDNDALARAQFYDGRNYIQALEGKDYTITFKYYVAKVKKVGTMAIFLSSAGNTWSKWVQQAGSFTYLSDTGVWNEAEIKFTANPATSADITMSLGVSGDAVVYIDDVVITCDENPMNHYGTALVLNTMGGNALPTISGQPSEKFTLPRPKRAGYLFKGWFSDSKCTKPFTETVFGETTKQIFAGWQLGSVTESFEDFPVNVKSLGVASAYKFYTKASDNFDKANIHHGATSLFRDGTSSGDKVFTLARSQDLNLTIGSGYTLTMWVKPVSVTNADCTISLAALSGFTKISNAKPIGAIAKVSDLKEGEWQQVTYHFTATSEFVGISTNAGCDMYIDNINITLDGYTGSDTGDSSINPILVIAMALVAAGALLVTAKKVFVK